MLVVSFVGTILNVDPNVLLASLAPNLNALPFGNAFFDTGMNSPNLFSSILNAFEIGDSFLFGKYNDEITGGGGS